METEVLIEAPSQEIAEKKQIPKELCMKML